LFVFVERSSTIERHQNFSKTGNDNLGCFIKQMKYFIFKKTM
jgi:hypothetical protein